MLGYLFLLSLLAGTAHSGCPNGWIKYSGSCYYFSADPTTFPKAAGVCRTSRSSLFVLPTSNDENHFVGQNVKYSGTWIANVRPDETRQVSGGYDNYDGKVSDKYFDDYSFMYPRQWQNADCSLKKGFICEVLLPGATLALCQVIDPLLSAASTKCFRIFTESQVTYDEAVAACTTQVLGGGGKLLVVDSPDTRDAVANAMKLVVMSQTVQRTTKDFWIGLRRANRDSPFVWQDGTQQSNAVNDWWDGNQNPSGDANCAFMLPSKWTTVSANDARENTTLGLVCKGSMGSMTMSNVASIFTTLTNFFRSFF
ncbi:unnamed protein product [Darwinula stevensoni]|uniref:C-type lectin domain-containing protein n=1 Tax=Darwinula stevensoni TaxID=69355 RepID=A0A7R9A9Z6_9CRUS|nr:unnamed protein product [Darwinula stevensoni]CAG0897940.1 unnamed protein product [Darwinula stevensoni]